jgi:aspartokinase
VPEARPIERLDFDEARELALYGASVLHPDALPAARRSGAEVRVRDVEHPDAPGTLVTGDGREASAQPVGIATEAELVALELTPDRCGELDRPLTELFALLGRHHIEPRFVVGGPARLTVFTARTPLFSELAAELSERVRLGAPAATLALVGGGGLAMGSRALGVLEARGIGVHHAFLSESRPSQVLLVAPADQMRAARALHAALLEPAPAG